MKSRTKQEQNKNKKQQQQGKKVCGVGYNDGNQTKRTREWPKIHCQVFSYKLHLRTFGKTAKYVQNNYDRRGAGGQGRGLVRFQKLTPYVGRAVSSLELPKKFPSPRKYFSNPFPLTGSSFSYKLAQCVSKFSTF